MHLASGGSDYCQGWRDDQPGHGTVLKSQDSTQDIALDKGVYLNVRINDPMGLLPQVIDGPQATHKLLVGIAYGTGAYQGATNTEVDSAGRGYQLIVPTGEPFYIRLYSTDVALEDASGGVMAAPAAGIAFQATAGQDQNFTFTIVGAAGHVQ
jgi:hypothetical protein